MEKFGQIRREQSEQTRRGRCMTDIKRAKHYKRIYRSQSCDSQKSQGLVGCAKNPTLIKQLKLQSVDHSLSQVQFNMTVKQAVVHFKHHIWTSAAKTIHKITTLCEKNINPFLSGIFLWLY